jgi:hypothetical protein
MLMFVATAALVGSFAASTNVISTNPTAVLTVQDEKTQKAVSIVLPDNLTRTQAHNISMAYDIGKKDGLAPALLPAIIMQETQAGEYHQYKVAGQEYGLAANKRYYGLAQIKLDAAKDVLREYPSLRDDFGFHTRTDEEIIAKLIENDRFNLSVASKYLVILKEKGFNTVKQLALAYNQGPGGAKSFNENTHHYPQGVMQNIQRLKTDA